MKVRRIDFSPDEWLAGTMNLNSAERGLYWDACAMIYSHGGPVPIDELKARSGDHGNAFNRNLRRLLALGKLVRNGREITNKRCEKELEKARKRAEKGREMADRRWNNNSLDVLQALPPSTGNHQPSTINHQPEEAIASSVEGACAPATPKERANGRSKPKTKIAADWEPDLADCRYAADRGWDAGRIGDEADRFRDRCLRDEAAYADWRAAWRTWCRLADDFAARNGNRGNGNRGNGAVGHAPPRSGSFAAAARNVMSRLDMGGE